MDFWKSTLAAKHTSGKLPAYCTHTNMLSGRRLPSCRPRSSWLTVSRQYDAGHSSYDDVSGRHSICRRRTAFLEQPPSWHPWSVTVAVNLRKAAENLFVCLRVAALVTYELAPWKCTDWLTCQTCSFSAMAATQYLPSGLVAIAVTLPTHTTCVWMWSWQHSKHTTIQRPWNNPGESVPKLSETLTLYTTGPSLSSNSSQALPIFPHRPLIARTSRF